LIIIKNKEMFWITLYLTIGFIMTIIYYQYEKDNIGDDPKRQAIYGTVFLILLPVAVIFWPMWTVVFLANIIFNKQ